jgi:exonuclease III
MLAKTTRVKGIKPKLIQCQYCLKYIGDDTKQGEGVRFYSMNVCGLRDKHKRSKIFTFLNSKKKGVILLQETYSMEGDEKRWARDWDGDIIMCHGSQHSRGTAILFPKNMTYTLENIIKDKEGRYIFVEGTFNSHSLSILNYYAPTRDKVNEQITLLNDILPIISEHAHKLIWAGDFNNCISPEDNFGNQANMKNNASIQLINIMEQEGLCDVWRVFNEDTKRATWRRSSYKGIQQSRIDFFLIPIGFIYNIGKCEISYGLYTDHSLLSIDRKSVV